MMFLSKVKLHQGDCLEVLPTLAENSIDACVTDPPYGLEFMGVAWDTYSTPKGGARADADFQDYGSKEHPRNATSQARIMRNKNVAFGEFSAKWAREVYRVLKPGAHLLAFGGTRTYHRMACAIEDAGFEIRDTISWNFGSGFPKSHSITKGAGDAICRCAESNSQLRGMRQAENDAAGLVQEDQAADMLSSMQRGITRQGMGDARPQRGSSTQDLHGNVRPQKSGMEGRGDLPEAAGELRQREVRQVSTGTGGDGSSRRVRDGTSADNGAMDRPHPSADGMCTSSGSQAAKQFAGESGTMAVQSQPQERGAWPHCGRCGKPIIQDGLGTALKPAMELICLARKPLSEKTVAANVLKWGTGALNIDGCRVEAISGDEPASWESPRGGIWKTDSEASALLLKSNKGRWPANVCHDGSEEVVGAFPDCKTGGPGVTKKNNNSPVYVGPASSRDRETVGYNDSGSAARFFYCAKADADNRIASKHPTVKPVDLIQYLIRLITPKGGMVLDPFAGTGTTGEAAYVEGNQAVLIEREAEYCQDIQRRMALVLSGPEEKAREMIKAAGKLQDYNDLPLFTEGPISS